MIYGVIFSMTRALARRRLSNKHKWARLRTLILAKKKDGWTVVVVVVVSSDHHRLHRRLEGDRGQPEKLAKRHVVRGVHCRPSRPLLAPPLLAKQSKAGIIYRHTHTKPTSCRPALCDACLHIPHSDKRWQQQQQPSEAEPPAERERWMQNAKVLEREACSRGPTHGCTACKQCKAEENNSICFLYLLPPYLFPSVNLISFLLV
jgi:hypothetical protein